ncbi:DUF2786 domain-containing protein [Pseudomonas citronellolis]|uniref:DUF2786 domain-containing protein n=1 Tax=Pseudomonas citronellolis TaxID=53408 RepID=UPI0020A17553|nr:DUF2786 domain-containing protein [Pseudomonas citronellolis]MCP1605751.1 hypothetical protein [Pseudomonas citronellolis]MCP1656094.1 hypothetical protein [Pseudomonas citronellolis]MCP1722254.1 hypothetical protein [Pseudomonas citronellolis]MDN6874663.1 DUF2786 domain-containing protein [Pseudomonas citronellolis]
MQAHQPQGGGAKASTSASGEIDEKVQAKLRKLQALAERGVGGEKVNAQRMLDKLLARHGITVEDLSNERRETRWFPAANRFDRNLAHQIMSKICDSSMVDLWVSKARPKQIGVDVTPAEAIEFELHYDALRKALAECFKDAFVAFVQANRLFPSTRDGDYAEPTDRDIAIMTMASAITPTKVNQRLEHVGGDKAND